jgi:Ca2+-binding RTX toxin-like protein
MIFKNNKSPFSLDLIELSQEFNDFTGSGTFKSKNKTLVLDETGEKVLVRITTNKAKELVAGSKVLDFTTEDYDSDFHFIEEFISIEKINTSLETILENRLLLGVLPVYKPIVASGSVTNQADFIQEADRVRNSSPLGYDGTGVKIGVLSDSYNSKNGATTDINSGDLPNNVKVINRDGVKQDLANGTDEGRAMLQLIHDIAPKADLSFATASTGESNFAANIKALAQDGANVIVDDVIYLAEPFFQDGLISLAVDKVVANSGVAYFSSAGNQAARSYESTNFAAVTDTTLDNILEQDTNLDDALDMVDSSGNIVQGNFTVPTGGYMYHDFNPSLSSIDNRQQITLANGQRIRLVFQWDDPFYTVAGVDTDLDLFLIDSDNKVVAYSFNDNIANRTPYEYLDFKNSSGTTKSYDIVIGKYSGPVSGRIKYVNYGSAVTPEYFTNSSTIYGHAAATNAEAVGAVPYYRQNQPESFTSLGPTTFLYEYQTDANGDPVAVVAKNNPEIRNKPDIAAIDGTDTTFFGSDIDGNGFPNFFGTSAAAPQAAAIAALLEQAEPNLTPTEIYQRLESSAIDISSVGFDYLTGNGLINAYDAIFGEVIAQSLIFNDNFEDGDLPLAYETNSNGGGRIQVTTANNPSGNYHLTLDNSFANVNSLNEVVLHLDTTNFSNLKISFDGKEFNDDDHLMPNSFTGSVNADGVAFSIDGNTWYRLLSLTGTNSTNTYQAQTFNLDDFIAANNLVLGTNLLLKFQQYGLNKINLTNSTASDGIAIDNIAISGTLNGSNIGDTIAGGIEANSIDGKDGKDAISGLAGNDTLNGGNDDDFITGGADNDLLHGNNGSDRVYGDDGNDLLYGDELNDLLQGGDGNDQITGGDGSDRLYGENDSDTLSGSNGQDILYGGAGDDFLDGGADSDRLLGNSGNDRFVIQGGDTIYDYLDGSDRLGISNNLTFSNLSIVQNGTNTEIKLQSSNELLATLFNININSIDSNDFVSI